MPIPLLPYFPAKLDARALRRALRTAFRHVALQHQIRRERQALRKLDSRLLRDIGLSQEAADREAARPDWDIPEHRLPNRSKRHPTGAPRPFVPLRLGS